MEFWAGKLKMGSFERQVTWFEFWFSTEISETSRCRGLCHAHELISLFAGEMAGSPDFDLGIKNWESLRKNQRIPVGFATPVTCL